VFDFVVEEFDLDGELFVDWDDFYCVIVYVECVVGEC